MKFDAHRANCKEGVQEFREFFYRTGARGAGLGGPSQISETNRHPINPCAKTRLSRPILFPDFPENGPYKTLPEPPRALRNDYRAVPEPPATVGNDDGAVPDLPAALGNDRKAVPEPPSTVGNDRGAVPEPPAALADSNGADRAGSATFCDDRGGRRRGQATKERGQAAIPESGAAPAGFGRPSLRRVS